MYWNPNNGGYLKTCPTCGEDFTGRKNKLYCSPICKNKQNNDKQLALRKKRETLTDSLFKNIQILEWQMAFSNKEVKQVSMDELRQSGFDPEAPRTSFKEKQTGKVWYRFGHYAISPSEQNGIMNITRITSNE